MSNIKIEVEKQYEGTCYCTALATERGDVARHLSITATALADENEKKCTKEEKFEEYSGRLKACVDRCLVSLVDGRELTPAPECVSVGSLELLWLAICLPTWRSDHRCERAFQREPFDLHRELFC